MRALVLATLLAAAACAPDVPVAAPDSAVLDAAADADAAVGGGTDAAGELANDVAVATDVASDVAVVDIVADPCAGLSCDDGNFCTSDACKNDACVHVAAPALCTDGDPCTVGDACQDGVCLPGAVTSCSDGLACTVDTCVPAVGCAWVVSATCDDGQGCTVDGCGKDGCTHSAVTCDDINPCTIDACDAASGTCSHTPVLACCIDKMDCDDGNACTLDACAANTCGHTLVAAGKPCYSGTCDGQGTCVPGAPLGMVLIPGGTFWMGCNADKGPYCNADENPHHKVTLSAYYADKTETTVAQYKACVDAGVCTPPSAVQPTLHATYPGLPTNPVNFVTWQQARQYCQWRGAGYDLPTEAQWEMAARGDCEKNGSTADDPLCAKAMRSYPWGEASGTCSYAVVADGSGNGCGTNGTWPVGSITQGHSAYGLLDMAGNVWEWTRDGYGPYTADAQVDPSGPTVATDRVYRGGSFFDVETLTRASGRAHMAPALTNFALGLRCMRAYP